MNPERYVFLDFLTWIILDAVAVVIGIAAWLAAWSILP